MNETQHSKVVCPMTLEEQTAIWNEFFHPSLGTVNFQPLAEALHKARKRASAAHQCEGCGASRNAAVWAVVEGRVACCPDCSTLTVEERNTIRDAIRLKRDAAGPLIAAALAMAKAIEERRPWTAEPEFIREARRYVSAETQPPRASAYGYCPVCRAPGANRERRPYGNDTCQNGHVYPSQNAKPTNTP